jgi:hypothetical protein
MFLDRGIAKLESDGQGASLVNTSRPISPQMEKQVNSKVKRTETAGR